MNKKMISLIVGLALVLLTQGCNRSISTDGSQEGIEKSSFCKTKDGKEVYIYILTNPNGMIAKITNYGATVTELWVPDQNGKMDDVVLGFDNISDYEEKSDYFGCIVGRYGNRIAKGRFALDGEEYVLATNNDENHLHGGVKGFDKVVWDAEAKETARGPALELNYLSKDGEEGYPGNLNVTVTYILTHNNELKIKYRATTDKPTVCNLTHHSYFNLQGQGSSDILDHKLMISADKYTPVDKGLIPTGEKPSVKGTPMDFNKATSIGLRIDADHQQIAYGLGYDHNWILDKKSDKLKLAASVIEPQSGRKMEVWTTEPGLQFYSGNFLNGSIVGKEGKTYKHRYGFCLETQHFPDSPNQPDFPSTTLLPGETYQTKTVYKFSVK